MMLVALSAGVLVLSRQGFVELTPPIFAGLVGITAVSFLSLIAKATQRRR
jgi:hypothetical protein